MNSTIPIIIRNIFGRVPSKSFGLILNPESINQRSMIYISNKSWSNIWLVDDAVSFEINFWKIGKSMLRKFNSRIFQEFSRTDVRNKDSDTKYQIQYLFKYSILHSLAQFYRLLLSIYSEEFWNLQQTFLIFKVSRKK